MSVVTYKCPSCGAGIAFDSASQRFKCEYCLSEFTEEEIRNQADDGAPAEESRTDEAENQAYCDVLLSYTCSNCGAEVFADENTAADICYYCHNPVVCSGRLTGQLRPHKIIPFAYDQEEAKSRFLAFARRKWFVPRDFFSEAHAEQIRGVYFPFWLTDADVTASASANATRVRTWKAGNKLYTETSHYRLFRRGGIHFEDIATSAYSGDDKKMLEGILPFPPEALKEFTMTYLSGFLAKKRNIERDRVENEVRGRINRYSTTLLSGTMSGYTTVTGVNCNARLEKYIWDYALMPLWILTYQKSGKTYTYAMNGHTGKIYGELPVSGGKLLALFGSLLVGVSVLCTLIGGLLL